MNRSSPEDLRRAARSLERSAARLESLQLFRLVERAGPGTWRGRVADDAYRTIQRRAADLERTIEGMRRRARRLYDDADRSSANG